MTNTTFCRLQLAWVYPCCLARSKFRSARQPGGYDRFLLQEFAKIWYPITERGGTERRWRVLCDRRKLVVRSYGSNMAAAEAKLSFHLAVDSVLDSLEQKFILKEQRFGFALLHHHQKGRFSLASNRDFCRFTYVIWYNWYDWLRATNRCLW